MTWTVWRYLISCVRKYFYSQEWFKTIYLYFISEIIESVLLNFWKWLHGCFKFLILIGQLHLWVFIYIWVFVYFCIITIIIYIWPLSNDLLSYFSIWIKMTSENFSIHFMECINPLIVVQIKPKALKHCSEEQVMFNDNGNNYS